MAKTMSGIFEGDDWKRVSEAKPETEHGPTRAEEQSRVDREYGEGRMPLSLWQFKTKELSEPTKWCTEGRL